MRNCARMLSGNIGSFSAESRPLMGHHENLLMVESGTREKGTEMETTTINGTRVEVQEINDDGSMVIQRWRGITRNGEDYGLMLGYEPTDEEYVYRVVWEARPYIGDGEVFGGELGTSDFKELGEDGYFDTWEEVGSAWDDILEAAELDEIDMSGIEVD